LENSIAPIPHIVQPSVSSINSSISSSQKIGVIPVATTPTNWSISNSESLVNPTYANWSAIPIAQANTNTMNWASTPTVQVNTAVNWVSTPATQINIGSFVSPIPYSGEASFSNINPAVSSSNSNIEAIPATTIQNSQLNTASVNKASPSISQANIGYSIEPIPHVVDEKISNSIYSNPISSNNINNPSISI
jgi:hypothetical protein